WRRAPGDVDVEPDRGDAVGRDELCRRVGELRAHGQQPVGGDGLRDEGGQVGVGLDAGDVVARRGGGGAVVGGGARRGPEVLRSGGAAGEERGAEGADGERGQGRGRAGTHDGLRGVAGGDDAETRSGTNVYA